MQSPSRGKRGSAVPATIHSSLDRKYDLLQRKEQARRALYKAITIYEALLALIHPNPRGPYWGENHRFRKQQTFLLLAFRTASLSKRHLKKPRSPLAKKTGSFHDAADPIEHKILVNRWDFAPQDHGPEKY